MSLRRLSVLAAAGISVGPWVETSARADVPTPAGLNPGDHFRLVFVTDGSATASSTDLSFYDSIVTSEASNAGLGTYNGSPVTWQTLGSLEGGTTATGRFSPVEPIFGLDGTKVADSGADLWDGSLDSAISQTPSGATLGGPSISVWTGSNTDGSEAKGLGGEAGFTTFGTIATDGTWVSSTTGATTDAHNLYGFSNELVVAPEPSMAGMLALGATLGAMRRQNRRGKRRR